MDRPLISFVLISYNQEGFIREALEGAFAQTYSPLEIIIADDCSQDGSYGIIEKMVASYRGPHSVRHHQNPTNLGIAKNVNRAMELCRGQLIVVAAGDDVSLPTRTEVIHRAWEDSGRKATALFSCYDIISEDGTEQGLGGTRRVADDHQLTWKLEGGLFQYLSTRNPTVHGCSAAYSPELLRFFGPLRGDLEDMVLSFRSLAIGQVLYLHKPLIKYRRHGSNASFAMGGEAFRTFENRERRLRRGNKMTVGTYDNHIADIDVLYQKGRITSEEHVQLKAEAQRVQTPYRLESQVMEADFIHRLRFIGSTAISGNLRGALRLSPRALPHPVYRALYLLKEKLRLALRIPNRNAFENW